MLFEYNVLNMVSRFVTAPRSSSSSGGTNNLPPLLFNQVHGDNIRISRNGTVARRVESFCKGIAFSARPVKVNEKVRSHFPSYVFHTILPLS